MGTMGLLGSMSKGPLATPAPDVGSLAAERGVEQDEHEMTSAHSASELTERPKLNVLPFSGDGVASQLVALASTEAGATADNLSRCDASTTVDILTDCWRRRRRSCNGGDSDRRGRPATSPLST